MFFSGWEDISRTIIVGTLAYAGLILLLRISGKRTLAKMNAFDFIVTVALGSTLATVLLSKQTTLVQGMTAFGLLIILQWLIAWLSVRSAAVRRAVRSDPTLLYYKGDFLDLHMRAERVNAGEVLAAIRSQGILQSEDVQAVVLESNGDFTVLRREVGSESALADVHGRVKYTENDGPEDETRHMGRRQ